MLEGASPGPLCTQKATDVTGRRAAITIPAVAPLIADCGGGDGFLFPLRDTEANIIRGA
jgi:hypothetical protein